MASWHEIGAIGLCKEDEIREFKVSNETVAIWCHGGEYHAFQGICPHMKVHLSKGKLEGTVISCPGHGTRYDLLTGEMLAWTENLHGAAKTLLGNAGKRGSLAIYPVKIVDKRVMVQF